MTIDIDELTAFIVRAKAATYVGSGEHVAPCRSGSHDLRYSDGEWAYHDSYFGGTDFIGEEVVYLAGKPIWAMNYYGRILRDDLLTAAQAGQMISHACTRKVVSWEALSMLKKVSPMWIPAKGAQPHFKVASSSAADRRSPMNWFITAA
jgi:hypothetical protein